MTERREDSQIHIAGDGKSQVVAALPLPAKRGITVALASASLPAAGAYATTIPYDVWKSRLVHVYLKVTGPGAGAAQRVSIVPEICFNMDDAVSDDLFFFPVSVTDGLTSNVDLAVNPGGTLYTGQNFGALTFQPLEIRTPALDANTNIIAMVINIDVLGAKWFRLKVAEFGDTVNPSTVEIYFGKSA